MDETKTQLQIRLLTKQSIYSVPDHPLLVPSIIDCKSLNQLLNQLLKESDPNYLKPQDFDFLISSELIRVPLNEHLSERNIGNEGIIDIEYIQKVPSPEPENSILHDDWVSSIKCSGKWILSGCYDNSISIWNSHGKPISFVKSHTDIVKQVAWINETTSTKTFASVSHDQTGIIWEWSEDSTEAIAKIQLRGHERGIDSVGISPNCTKLATGGWDTNLKIWSASLNDTDDSNEPSVKKSRNDGRKELRTRTPLHTLNGHKESICSINWIDDTTVCTVSMDHTIKFWDCDLYGIKNEIVDQKAFLSSSWSSLSNTLLATMADRHIRLYDPRSTEGNVCKLTFTSHSAWVSCVTWSKYDEYLFLSGGYDSTVKMWDIRSTKAPLYNFEGHEGHVMTVDWSNNKYLMSGGTDNSIHIFRNKQII